MYKDKKKQTRQLKYTIKLATEIYHQKHSLHFVFMTTILSLQKMN